MKRVALLALALSLSGCSYLQRWRDGAARFIMEEVAKNLPPEAAKEMDVTILIRQVERDGDGRRFHFDVFFTPSADLYRPVDWHLAGLDIKELEEAMDGALTLPENRREDLPKIELGSEPKPLRLAAPKGKIVALGGGEGRVWRGTGGYEYEILSYTPGEAATGLIRRPGKGQWFDMEDEAGKQFVANLNGRISDLTKRVGSAIQEAEQKARKEVEQQKEAIEKARREKEERLWEFLSVFQSGQTLSGSWKDERNNFGQLALAITRRDESMGDWRNGDWQSWVFEGYLFDPAVPGNRKPIRGTAGTDEKSGNRTITVQLIPDLGVEVRDRYDFNRAQTTQDILDIKNSGSLKLAYDPNSRSLIAHSVKLARSVHAGSLTLRPAGKMAPPILTGKDAAIPRGEVASDESFLVQLPDEDAVVLSARELIKGGNPVAAFQLLSDSQNEKNAYALNELGICFRKGTGTAQDYAKAKECFIKAAELGNGTAAVNYGVMVLKGEGEPSNPTFAFKIFKEGAERQHRMALYFYGLALIRGAGCEKNPLFGAKQIAESAKLGYGPAIGWCKESGVNYQK